jgi:methylenetetrahydrofolate reductase (NADPH)
VRIDEIIASKAPTFSVELFPPKTEEGSEALFATASSLRELNPDFVSVTYGAGGSTRDRTIDITGRIARETSMTPMAHLTCVGHTVSELDEILDLLAAAGVGNVLALRGDPVGGPGTPWTATDGGLNYAAELVGHIRARHQFAVGVAVFPEGHRDAPDFDHDLQVMRAKYDAGAEFAITEMVLRSSDYFGLVERAQGAGIDFPIVPGIMPILNLNSMRRMVELSGREMPDEVLHRIEPLADDPDAVRAEGIRIATELCDDLLAGGAPGLHFYTLNRSKATREIYQSLACHA